MSKQYGWALNKQKLARAIGVTGPSASEEEVKKEYLKIGGKVVLSDLESNKMDENKEEVIIETEEAQPMEATPEVGGTVEDIFNETSEESASAPEVESEVTASDTVEPTSEVTSTE